MPGDAASHPLIYGLFRELPQPETLWDIEQRVDWLEAAEHIFRLMYRGAGKLEIAAQPAERTAAEMRREVEG